MQCLVCMTNVCLSYLYLCFVFLTKPIWILSVVFKMTYNLIFNLVYFEALTSCHFRYKKEIFTVRVEKDKRDVNKTMKHYFLVKVHVPNCETEM